MQISNLFADTKDKGRKRVGRGIAGSGGKTAGRGTKGQKSRTGANRKLKDWFEGGQTPLYRKMAKKRGFNHADKKDITVTTTLVNKFYKDGEIVSPATLIAKKIVRNLKSGQLVKVVRRGDLAVKVKFEAVKVSKSLQT